MRVLVKEGATRMNAATILVLPGGRFRESVLATLAGEGHTGEGFVADAIASVVAGAITGAMEVRRSPIPARDLFADMWWMARILSPYLIGSRVLQHVTSTGCIIDCSEAIRRDGLSRGG